MEIIKLEKNHIRNALELGWEVFQEFEAPEKCEIMFLTKVSLIVVKCNNDFTRIMGKGVLRC